MLLGKHIKMARILVNMSQTELGKLVGISDDSIGRMELSQGIARGKVSNLNKIKQIFEKKGIEFIYGKCFIFITRTLIISNDKFIFC